MDKRGSVGELPLGGIVLGVGPLWRRYHAMGRAYSGGSGDDVRNVLAQVFSIIIYRLDRREAEWHCQGGGRKQNEAPEELG